MTQLAMLLAKKPQIRHRQSEEIAHEFLLQIFVEAFNRCGCCQRRFSAHEFCFGAFEIKRHVQHVAPALQPARGFRLIGNKMVHAHAQKGSQTRLGRIEITQIFLFDQLRKKFLRRVLGIFIGFIPAYAQVFINGLPVEREDRIERPRSLPRIVTTRSHHGGPARRGKFSTGAADPGVFLDYPTPRYARPARSDQFPRGNRAAAAPPPRWCVPVDPSENSARTLRSPRRSRSCPSGTRPGEPRDPAKTPPPARWPSNFP